MSAAQLQALAETCAAVGVAYIITAVGSRVTCDPPVVGTDADYLVLVDSHNDFRPLALSLGYEVGGSLVLDTASPLDAEDRFSSYTNGEINLIVTSDVDFADRFIAASSVAKRLNLLNKGDRIALFQAVLYANSCGGIEPMMQGGAP